MVRAVRNIYVVGLDDFHRHLLETVRGAEHYRFHGLIPYREIVNPEHYSIDELLAHGRRDIEGARDSVDAIIGHWDFPATSLLPVLRGFAGLGGPRLEAMLTCDHKYWARCAQALVHPDSAPPYAVVDPRDHDAQDHPPLDYPFWLKPVVAFSSYLGFRVEGPDDYLRALRQIRAGINRFAEPFNRLAGYAGLDLDDNRHNAARCIAEGLIGGHQCTLEGYVLAGEARVYGVVDSLRGENQVSFVGYHYPSDLPAEVRQRMIDCACTVIPAMGLERAPFNVEFFWDEERDDIKLLEVNARISKSHSPLFHMVNGASHHEVAIDLALGRVPDFPRDEGAFRHAAKFMPRSYDDARVLKVPGRDELHRLHERFPGALFMTYLHQGMWLSELRNQDSYSFELADLFLGADSRKQLLAHFREAMQILDFRFSQPVRTNFD